MTDTLRAPFPWFGGKSRVAHVVWERFGDVANYVEPFFGSGAVLLGRPTVPRIETVNDKDCYLANFWRATVADPEAVAYHADWPVNEADLHARHLWLVNTGAERVERLKTDPDYYDPLIAGWWVWGICQWIGSGWCSRPDWETRPDLTSDGRGVHAPTRKVPYLTGRGQGVHQTGFENTRPHLGTAGTGVHKKLPALGDAGRGVHRALHHPSRQLPAIGDAGRGDTTACVAPSRQLPHLGNAGRGDASTGVTSLVGWMADLAERLRRVRVCCGDWRRVVTPAVTFRHGITGVLLDPPYSHDEREVGVYAEDHDVGAEVRAWAIENGGNPELRIALCGYEGEHDMPAEWSVHAWKAHGGYGGGRGTQADANSHRERIWFSPHCLGPHTAQLAFDFDERVA